MTLAELQSVVEELHMPRFTARQLLDWLYVKHATTFDAMTNLSKAHRELLCSHCVTGLETPAEAIRSVDGTV